MEGSKYEDGALGWHYLHDVLSCYAVARALPPGLRPADAAFAESCATDIFLAPYAHTPRCADGVWQALQGSP